MPSPWAYNAIGGALSKAIGDSFSGLTQGAIGGEEIRQKRAQEDLRNQQLAMQQAHYNQLAQQFQQHYGLNIGQFALAQQKEAREAAIAQSKENRELAMFPANVAYKQAQTAAQASLPAYHADTIAERQRWHNIEQQNLTERNDVRWASLEDRINRTHVMAQRAAQSTALSPAERLQAQAYQTQLRTLRQQMAVQSQWGQTGQVAPGIPPMIQLRSQMSDIEAQVQGMADRAAGKATPGPGEVAPDAFRKQWNYLLNP